MRLGKTCVACEIIHSEMTNNKDYKILIIIKTSNYKDPQIENLLNTECTKKVDKACTKDKVLHIVVDNLSAHKTKKVYEYLAAVPERFVLHFIPTHSSWLNMVERWFAEITNKRIRRGSFESVRQLINAIKEYIKV